MFAKVDFPVCLRILDYSNEWYSQKQNRAESIYSMVFLSANWLPDLHLYVWMHAELNDSSVGVAKQRES